MQTKRWVSEDVVVFSEAEMEKWGQEFTDLKDQIQTKCTEKQAATEEKVRLHTKLQQALASSERDYLLISQTEEKIAKHNADTISKCDTPLETLIKRQQEIKGNQDAATTYLTSLKDSPKVSFDALRDRILTDVTEYTLTAARQQSPAARLALHRFQDKIKTIQAVDNNNLLSCLEASDHKKEAKDDDETRKATLATQVRYACLVGFLWQTFTAVNDKDSDLGGDNKVAALFHLFVQNTHIPKSGCLAIPPFSDSKDTCEKLFKQLSSRFGESLQPTETGQFYQAEMEAYQKALDYKIENKPFGDILVAMQQQAKKLVIQHPEQRYFYTRVLQDTYDLFTNFTKQKLNNYNKLLRHAEGAPDCFWGLMSLAAGTILLVVGIAAFCSGLVPLAGCSIKMGITLNTKALAILSMAMSLPLFCGGGYLMFSKGLNKQMTKFAAEIEKPANQHLLPR